MKKLTLFAVCLLVIFVSGSPVVMAAGDETPGGIKPGIGVMGGINRASLRGADAGDVIESRLGFVGGGFLRIPLGSTLALQPEILFAQKGGKYNGNSYSLDYVEIPILLNVSLLGPLGVLLGPSFDFNVAKSGVDNINKTNIALVLGAQLNISKLLVSGRYEVGMTDLGTDPELKSGTFTLLVGLSFI